MTNQEIMDLVSCFDQSTAQTMKVTREGFTLELTREAAIGRTCAGSHCLCARPRSCTGCRGGLHRNRPPGGDLLRRPQSRAAALCEGRRPGEKGRDPVPH